MDRENEGYYLQVGAKDALLNALLLAAKRFSSGPPQLLTQICLALSALVIRSTEHRKPIEQLFYGLQNLQSQDDSNIAVLEMLTVLPEEIVENQNADCDISSDRGCQYGQELLSHTTRVLEFLLQQSEKSFDGETNFGFYNGVNTGADGFDYKPDLTPYDFDALIRESGDVGIAFWFRSKPFCCSVTDVEKVPPFEVGQEIHVGHTLVV